MILNQYEFRTIKNSRLPESWQSQNDLDELELFLQQNWEQRGIFYDDGEVSSRQQFLKFLTHGNVKTQNYIGTIAYNGSQLNIFPKVFKTEKDDNDTEDLTQEHLMKNLVRWLEYCNRMEYPFISVSTELEDSDNLKELFITLYISCVRSALERGLFYRYVEETENIRTIRGKFDFKDYIIRKIPNGQADRFRCTYSNFEFDNMVNIIIKNTCTMLLNETKGKNLATLRRILTKLEPVSDVRCFPSDCDSVRLSRMHSNYRVIISMSKMFLLNRTANYSMDINESFCFLFPAELLFEGFIGGFMQEVLEPYGGKVMMQKSDMSLIDDIKYKGKSLGSAFTMRHDILVELQDTVFVLDTKYKEVSRFEDNVDEMKALIASEPKQTDIYQVCEYARKRNLKDVYLLYPMFRFEDREDDFPSGRSDDANGSINIHFVRLPFVFEDDDDRTREQLKDVIVEILDAENEAKVNG